MSERSGLISLDKGKRRTRKTETKEAGEPMTETTKETVTTITLKEMGMSDAKIDELAKRLMETDSTMAVVSQRHETDMANLNTRLNEHDEDLRTQFDRLVNVEEGVKEIYHNIRDDLNGIYRNLKDMEQVVTGQKTETDRRLDNMNLRLIDMETANRTADVLEAKISALDAQIKSETRRLDARCNSLTDRVLEAEKGVGETSDMTEQVEILRDKVRSQEAIIAELESKVAKLETDVGETFAEAGRMIRDVKDESTQRAEEIAKEMETRLMVRSQEETDEKLKEATRIQNKDITVMKQKMENVFSRMKRVEEDPTLKAIRLEAEQTRRDARAMMWVSAGSLLTSMAVALVMVFRLAGGF